jgi:hypothetical protein
MMTTLHQLGQAKPTAAELNKTQISCIRQPHEVKQVRIFARKEGL